MLGGVLARDARGFSLFELIVVLLIIGVASAFAAPAIQSGWESRQIRQGTRRIAGVMRSLRERAIRRGVEQEIVLEPDGETLHWSDDQEATLPEGVAIIGVRGGWPDQDGRVHVIFYPNGGTTGLSALVSSRRTGALQFSVDVEPLIGSVVVREVRG